jgi:leucyl-tRNA synthetase
MVLAPENPLVGEITTKEQAKEVEKYITTTKGKTELDRMQEKQKTGVFTGSFAINPVNDEKIPIWISDYVLMGYGTGAIMAVPAHDERDYEFAKKFDLPITPVIARSNTTKQSPPKEIAPGRPESSRAGASASLSRNDEEMFTGYGLLINSAEFDGLTSEEAQDKIIAKLSEKKLAEKKINYKLRDWLISRQRYWGAPIPIVYCNKCGEVPVPEKNLPVVLPEEVKMKPTGESPLRYEKDFYETTCPACGGQATRETDTMDTFVCSSWYYLRYADPKNDKAFADKDKLRQWLPVDMYIGGAEHTVLHLLYSRFFTKALRDGGYLDFDEPFIKLRHQGMILGPDGLKMSKSKGNVIDPDIEVDKYGADAVRMYLAFMGPYEQGGPWNPNGLVGVRRFLDKFYDFAQKICSGAEKGPTMNSPEQRDEGSDSLMLDRVIAKLVDKVSRELPEMKFNTCVSGFMETLNNLVDVEKRFSVSENVIVWKRAISQMLLLMAPFTPHLAEELWSELGNEGSVHIQAWPVVDKALLKDELITIAVQVNGKVRDSLLVSVEVTEKEVIEMAKSSLKVQKYLEGHKIHKEIYIKGKILSIVTN